MLRSVGTSFTSCLNPVARVQSLMSRRRDGQPIGNGLNSGRGRGGHGSGTARQTEGSPSNSSDAGDFVSVVALLGGIQKTPYEIQVACAPNAFSFAAAAAAKSGVKSNPFGNNLSAVVLITDTNISLHSTSYTGSTLR